MSNQYSRRPLILDLDFTLLHLEYIPDSIEVPGRTRSAWIAPRTVALLDELQEKYDIVLATARSWDGTKWVSDGLAERGVVVSGVVIEDGALYGSPDNLQPMDAAFEVENARALIESQKRSEWPDYEWQFDFKACLVARCQNVEAAAELHQIFEGQVDWSQSDQKLRFFRDGRKIYVISEIADKWNALQKLLGEKLENAAGVGDGANDVCWLPKVAKPCTFANAKLVLVEQIRARNGFVTPKDHHEGIAHILSYLSTGILFSNGIRSKKAG